MEFQSVPTSGAAGWAFFEIGGQQYLAVAENVQAPDSFGAQSSFFEESGRARRRLGAEFATEKSPKRECLYQKDHFRIQID